ncbi:hypothetical protein M9Y10_041680 [Tritrichomonas musculus]|uniref:Uncharacterized protein n=1 Tax=Tritrichomonas musculus TaxID=1915356 RepID=A0ABR2K620_9EUKA
MILYLCFSLAIRLDPPPLNIYRDFDFMDTFTLLDKDSVTISGKERDIFVAIQPHSIMGHVFSTVYKNSIEKNTIQHSVGERFYVSNQDLKINYSYRGGVVVHVWSLPRGMCDTSYTIYSAGQRSATIHLNEIFNEDTKICWLLNFKGPVDFDANFINGSQGSKLIVGDFKHLITKHFYEFQPGQNRNNNGLNKTHMILLNAKEGPTSINIDLKSQIPYADWTDNPSLFVKRGGKKSKQQLENQEKNLYLETVRNVQTWIWLCLFGMFGSILGFTFIIFFIRPFKKIHKSLSHPDLSKDGKSKTD